MGSNEYSKPKEEEIDDVPATDKFVAWFNALEFKDDAEMENELVGIMHECNTRLSLMKDEKE